MRKKLWSCQDLLDLRLEELRVAQGVPDALVFTIQTWGTAEPIAVTMVPAYKALGKERGSPPDSYPCPPGKLAPPPPLIHGYTQTPALVHSIHVLCWVLGNHRVPD